MHGGEWRRRKKEQRLEKKISFTNQREERQRKRKRKELQGDKMQRGMQARKKKIIMAEESRWKRQGQRRRVIAGVVIRKRGRIMAAERGEGGRE